MRLILLASLVALSCAVHYEYGPFTGQYEVYKPGREYIYAYEGQILTGIPTASSHYAGFKVKINAAKIQIVAAEAGALKAVLKLEDVAIYKVHGAIGEAASPTAPLPEGTPAMEVVTSTPEGMAIVSALTAPCTFHYAWGVVSDLKFAASDTIYSINLKKGLINLFRLTLKPYSAISGTTSEKDASYVITSEEDALGKCDSMYNIKEAAPLLKVTKIRKLDSCVAKPYFEYGLFAGLLNLPHDKPLVEPIAHYDYEIYGGADGFMIKAAYMNGYHALMPYTKASESIATYHMQKLVFVSAAPISAPISFAAMSLIPSALQIEHSVKLYPEMSYKARAMMAAGPIASHADIQVVDSLLSEIAAKMTASAIDETVPALILKCSYYLKTFATADIVQILRQYKGAAMTPIVAKKIDILLDILPTLPSVYAPEILVAAIKEGVVSGFRASVMINMAALTAHPTPDALHQWLALYKSYSADILVKRALILGIGTLADRMANMHYKSGIPVATTKNVLRGVTSEVLAMLSRAADIEEKVRLIKCLGNIGDAALIPELTAIVADINAPVVIRTNAIYAMRKFAYYPTYKTGIANILLPVYMNTAEHYRVRIAAFAMLMHSRPAFHTLQMIAHSLEVEPVHQIHAFVYSYLVKSATFDAKEPWMTDLIVSIKKVLKAVKPVPYGTFDSKYIAKDIKCEYARAALVLEGLMVKSPHSALPEALVAIMKKSAFGYPITVLETGIQMDGVEALFKRIISACVSSGTIPKLSSMLNWAWSSATPFKGSHIAKELESILNQLPVHDMGDEEFAALAYVKMLGHELQYITIDSSTVYSWMDALRTGSVVAALEQGIPFSFSKAIPLVDNALVFPSPLGVPVTVNFTAVPVIYFDFVIKVAGVNLASIFSSGSFSSAFYAAPIKINIAYAISTPTEMALAVGSDLALFKTGALANIKIFSKIPVEHEIVFDPATAKLKFTCKPAAAAPAEFFKIVIEPATYFLHVPLTLAPARISRTFAAPHLVHKSALIAAWAEFGAMAEFKPIKNPVAALPVVYKVPIPLLVSSAAIEISAKFALGVPAWSAKFPFMGKQEIIFAFKPLAAAAAAPAPAIKIEVVLAEFYKLYSCAAGASYAAIDPDFMPVTPDAVIAAACAPVHIPITIMPIAASHIVAPSIIKAQIAYIRDAAFRKHQFNIQFIGKNIVALAPAYANIKIMSNIVLNCPDFMINNPGAPVAKIAIGIGKAAISENTINIETVKVPAESFAISAAAAPVGYAVKAKIAFNLPAPEVHSVVEAIYGIFHTFLIKKWEFFSMAPAVSAYSPAAAYAGAMYDAASFESATYGASATMAGASSIAEGIPIVVNSLPAFLKSALHGAIPGVAPYLTAHLPVSATIVAKIKCIPHWEQVVAVVVTPAGSAITVAIPFKTLAPLFPFSVSYPVSLKYPPTTYSAALASWAPAMRTGSCPFKSGVCSVSAGVVSTFDGHSIAVPAHITAKPYCGVILAKDCGPSKLFHVIAHYIAASGEKAITIVAPEYKIEVIPMMSSSWFAKNVNIMVKVNGVEKVVSAAAPIVLRSMAAPSGEVLYKVELVAGAVHVKAVKLGLTVISDGVNVNAKVSSWYQGQMCGICGDFNADIYNDMAVPWSWAHGIAAPPSYAIPSAYSHKSSYAITHFLQYVVGGAACAA